MRFKKIVLSSLLVILTGLLVLVIRFSIATTPAMKDGGIAGLEKIQIGGVDQWILIRGENVSKPVLLFLHGGPGFAEMVLTRQLNAELEKNFIVVNWDQRGAGKSFSEQLDEKTVTSEQLLSDTYELVQYLKKRFHRDKIFLLGHSWGSYLGLKTAYDHPDDFYAYIGIGQLINGNKGEQLSYEWTKKMALQAHNEKAINELEAINIKEGIYRNGMEEKHIERKWLWYYKGFLHNLDTKDLYYRLLIATEYTIFDKINFIKGIDYSEGNIGEQWLQNLKFDEEIKSIKTPVYFIQGKYDYNTPSELVRDFYVMMDAPRKEYIEFENSAHSPNYEEPVRFCREMRRISQTLLKNY